jgi:hypothetical protein
MFEECLTTIKKESEEASKNESVPDDNNNNNDTPKDEGLGNLEGMFKDFERIAKE